MNKSILTDIFVKKLLFVFAMNIVTIDICSRNFWCYSSLTVRKYSCSCSYQIYVKVEMLSKLKFCSWNFEVTNHCHICQKFCLFCVCSDCYFFLIPSFEIVICHSHVCKELLWTLVGCSGFLWCQKGSLLYCTCSVHDIIWSVSISWCLINIINIYDIRSLRNSLT